MARGRKRKSQQTSPEGLGSLMGGLRLPTTVKDHLRSHEVWSKWSSIVGPELARVTCPIEIRSRVLVVQVAHQAWAQQLHFLKPSLLAKIRSFSQGSKIKDLQFRVGVVKSHLPSIVPIDTERESDVQLEAVRLSERQEMTLRSIEDNELRAAIRKAMEAEVARQLRARNSAGSGN